MTGFSEIKNDLYEAVRAYQHFLFYIDRQHLAEHVGWDQYLTNHFLEKLDGLIDRNGSYYTFIDVVVKWVQEMTKDNQDKLFDYIFEFHWNKW